MITRPKPAPTCSTIFAPYAWTRSVRSRLVVRKSPGERVGFGISPGGTPSAGLVTWQTPVMIRPIPPRARVV